MPDVTVPDVIVPTQIGGWTPWRSDFTEEAKDIFRKTVGTLIGVSYTPLEFATQVVHGINYCFLCTGKVIYPDAPVFYCKAYVFVPLPGEEGKPYIKEIEHIEP